MHELPRECPSIEVLEGIALGRPASATVNEHVAQCDECRQTIERLLEDNRYLTSFAVDGSLLADAPAPASTPIDFPGYEIVREIHRGGQGVVYQAIQRSTKRGVAIKVMKHGPFATLSDRARFDREIETLGRLNHPNIVAVHDAGAIAGCHYFVMDYVDGEPFDAWVAGQRAASGGGRRALLETVVKICEAVHAAHLRGIIHRDLKPSNIRIDGAGEPHILDFGLAKSTDDPGDSAMTQTGQFVGSLPWASPEQVEGAVSKIDIRTDVYSLGVILFQSLTGVLPFEVGSNLRNTLDSILFKEAPRPGQVAAAAVGGAAIDEELDTIVLKCLSKDRDRRYQSAGELARDLRCYLAGEPIDAKRDSAMYVLRKTLRRYRRRVALAATLGVLFAMFGGVMAVLYRQSTRLEREAVQSAESLSRLLSQSNLEQGRMAGVLGNIEQAERLLWNELLGVRAPEKNVVTGLNDPPGAAEAYWGLWELYRRHPCLRTVVPQPETIHGLTLADDGRSLWVTDCRGLIQKLDEHGQQVDAYRLTFQDPRGLPLSSATGRTILKLEGDRIGVWDREHGDRQVISHDAPRNLDTGGYYVSRSGRLFAIIAQGAAALWSVDPAVERARFHVDDAELTAVAVSNNDFWLAARDQLGRVYLWEIASGRRVAASPATALARVGLRVIGELQFSVDDRYLADGWVERPGCIWDLSADPLRAIQLLEQPGQYRAHAFSPDGSLLAIGELGGAVRIFDATTGQRRRLFVAHPGRVRSVTFTGDGRGIWTSGETELRMWEVGEDAGIRKLRIEGELFHSVDVSPDQRWLVAAGGLGRVHRINLETRATETLSPNSALTISTVAYSPDGLHIAAGTYSNDVCIWDTRRLDQTHARLHHPEQLAHLCFSPDGDMIATSCEDYAVRVWRRADGEMIHEFRDIGDRIPEVVFDPTGRRLAGAVRNGALLMWDLESGTREVWSPPTAIALRTVAFSPDGHWLYTGGGDRTVVIWDVARRERVASLIGHNQEIYSLDVNRDGDLIVTGDSGGTIRLWHARLRRPLATLDGHSGSVMAVRFGGDGRTLASASLDGTVRWWDLGYYERHIVGNLETQLRRAGADRIDAARAEAWRRWGRERAAVFEGAGGDATAVPRLDSP